MRWVGFSHSAVGGCRGALGLFELVSSSCSVSLICSLLPLVLSPSPSSDRVKSGDTSVSSPSRVFTLSVVAAASGGTSGSFVSVWVRSGWAPAYVALWERPVVFGGSSFDLFGCPSALFLPFSAMAAAPCGTVPSVVTVFVVLSPASGWVSGSCVAGRSGIGRGRVSFVSLGRIGDCRRSSLACSAARIFS